MVRPALLVLFITLAGCGREPRPAVAQGPTPLRVTPQQFRSLAWLEGRWRGTLNDSGAFYEGYRFLDDSTLVSLTFADSAAARPSDSTLIRLRGGTVTSGDSTQGYVLTALDSSSVRFDPRGRARNAFTWARRPDGNWTATLMWRDSGRLMQRVYVMRRNP